jgi:uncharacterized protein with ParB-like and HNH nuclease domain
MNEIKVEKMNITNTFTKRWYLIPTYQRPYVWEIEQVNTLLKDILESLKDKNSEYFLGSIILLTKKNEGEAEILDGQQRLITLFLIYATLRDLVENVEVKKECQEKIFQEKRKFSGIPEKIRIEFSIRDKAQNFVEEFVKEKGKLVKLDWLQEKLENTKNITVKNMIKAIFTIKKFFKKMEKEEIEEFLAYLNLKVILIHISSSSLGDAFKLFTVMNDRGIRLRNSDILKAMNLKKVPENERERYARKWEDIEKQFGEEFDQFLSLLRTIITKEKATKNLLKEFEEKIYSISERNVGKQQPLLKVGKETIEFIEKYAEEYEKLFAGEGNNPKIENLIRVMEEGLSSDLWKAPLLRYSKKFGKEKISQFLEMLDNKVSADWIVEVTPWSRIENINQILKEIEKADTPQTLLKSEVFKIDFKKLSQILKEEDIYRRKFTRYILLKLNYLYIEEDTTFYIPKTITVEHILPQTPKKGSQWETDFSEEERKKWVNKLGNLLLMSRKKNSSLSNLNFSDKKRRYFATKIELFPHSIYIINNYTYWNPTTLKENHSNMVNQLKKHYLKNINY